MDFPGNREPGSESQLFFKNQFCDIAKVAIIHMKIYSNSAITKIWKWNQFQHPSIFLATYLNHVQKKYGDFSLFIYK
jgi:hypothetical protein